MNGLMKGLMSGVVNGLTSERIQGAARHDLCVKQTSLAVLLLCATHVAPLQAAEDTSRFYTVIDETGHMRTLERPKQPYAATAPKPASSDTPADPLSSLNGEQYVDSDYLQKRKFNLEGKKQFYTVPDGLGGTQVLERTPGSTDTVSAVGESPPVLPSPSQALITLAERYQRVPGAQITQLIGISCLAPSALKQAKVLRAQPLNLWPRSDAPSVNHKAALNYVLVDLHSGLKDLSLQSYAPLGKNFDYYWPLVVFMDDRGCVVEGVNAFYQKTLPSTMLQQSGLVGTLHIPDQSRYMLLTPLVEAIDLPHIRLSEVGQVRVIPLR
jgi:hypothetical protein